MKKLETVRPVILVQEILIHWYKDERGSAFARERSQLPRRLRLPEESLTADTLYLYQAAQPFFKNGALHDNTSIKKFQKLPVPIPDSIRIEETDSGILVYLHPRRVAKAKKVVGLALGQWLQFRWNERIAYESTWAYEERTLNIALIDSKKYDAQLFISSEPNETFSQLVRLY